ncbi:MAG: peptide ABC transporter substrate-binding protein [SAR202 cluster bacterium]|nr:peptide ABC transporter substrate-binding protein [SAR202 cluster bacterium]
MPVVAALLLLLAAIAGCTGDATATPSATPTGQQPLPTPGTPVLKPILTPPEGYRALVDLMSGFALAYPMTWTEASVPQQGTLATLYGPGGAPLVSVLSSSETTDVPLEKRLRPTLENFARSYPAGTAGAVERVTLDDGNSAARAEFSYEIQGQPALTRVQVVARGPQSLFVFVTTPQSLMPTYGEAIGVMLDSLTLFPPSTAGVNRDGALTMAGGNPTTLDPAMARESSSISYIMNLFSGLVRFDESVRLQPDLASRWEVDPSGTVYTFFLRDAIAFHDGRPITADDFKYSIERAAEPALMSDTAFTYLGDIVGARDKMAGRVASVSGVVAVDARTLRITIDGAKPYFLAKLSYPTAAVVDRRNVERGGREWWRRPNGSGPFRLGEWRPNELLALERFDAYKPAPSTLARVNFLILAGPPEQLYEQDRVDVAPIGGASVDRARDPIRGIAGQLAVFPQLTTHYIGFNAKRPPFDDPKVRQAFAMAVDRERFVEVVLQGQAYVARGILPPGMPGHSNDSRGVPFDADRARALLAESTHGGAERLPKIVFTTAGFGSLPSDIQFLVNEWRRNLGVDVEVRQLDPTAYIYQLSDEVDHLFEYGWGADYPDPENFLDVLFSAPNVDHNIGGYENAAFEALLLDARTEADAARRIELYQRAERMLLEDAAAIPLYHPRDYMLIKPYVRNFSVGPLGFPQLQYVTIDHGR